MVKIDWKKFVVALIVLKVVETALRFAMNLSGFCLTPSENEVNEYGVHCLANIIDIFSYSPLAVLIFISGLLFVPALGCFAGVLFYFRKHAPENRLDAVIFLVVFATGALIVSFLISFGQHLLFDPEPLFDPSLTEDLGLFFVVLALASVIAFGLFLGVYLFAAFLGGGIAYLLSKPNNKKAG